MHDIPDGIELVDPFDHDGDRIWKKDNGVNILGAPMGSSSFVSGYLRCKGLKHLLLLRFIKDVAVAGFPRETGQMLKGVVVSRLSHIPKSVQKNNHTARCMAAMGGAHLLAWLHCLTSSEDLENDLGAVGKGKLSELLDLPPSYWGEGLDYSFWLRPRTRSTWDLSRGLLLLSSHFAGAPNYRHTLGLQKH